MIRYTRSHVSYNREGNPEMDSADPQLWIYYQPVRHLLLWGQGQTMIENSIYTGLLKITAFLAVIH